MTIRRLMIVAAGLSALSLAACQQPAPKTEENAAVADAAAETATDAAATAADAATAAAGAATDAAASAGAATEKAADAAGAAMTPAPAPAAPAPAATYTTSAHTAGQRPLRSASGRPFWWADNRTSRTRENFACAFAHDPVISPSARVHDLALPSEGLLLCASPL